MNSYAKKLMTYHKVHQLRREGLSIVRISKTMELDWRTVKKYLSLTELEYEQFLQQQGERKKELVPYENFVKARLSRYPETSAAQMHDWLKEHYADFPLVDSKTVFNFVCWVRQKYHLQKIGSQREYAMVPECAYGAQAQVDFGEYNLRNSQGRSVKVYFFILTLSRSRYKYAFFTTAKFTTELSVQAHQQAFAYFEGMPETVVYDQDRLFLVNENYGDLILTEKFRNYTRAAGFALHFCRKSDPESKGKIESSVRYIKQNFLYNRPFDDIDMLNQEALAWLSRTANYLPHAVTRKSPAAEWAIEKAYLRPVVPVIVAPTGDNWYTVRKDNSISYKGNFYSLPLGTYAGKGSRVRVVAEQGQLVIMNEEGMVLCRHQLSASRGHKIINNDHKRDKGIGVRELILQVCGNLEQPELGNTFIEAIRQVKPRYLRDQVVLFRETMEEYPRQIITEALQYCTAHGLSSAVDLRSVAAHLHQQQAETAETARIIHMNPFNGKMPGEAFIQPATSSIADYHDMF